MGNAQCSVQAKFPREFPEYNKELQACVKEEFVPTQITPIFQKAVSGNGIFELGLGGGMVHGGRMNSEVSGGAGYGTLQEGLGCLRNADAVHCNHCSRCCSGYCANWGDTNWDCIVFGLLRLGSGVRKPTPKVSRERG